MATDIGLGLKTISPRDLVKDGDDVISGNALAALGEFQSLRGRAAVLEGAAGFGDPLVLTDQMVAAVIADQATATAAALKARNVTVVRNFAELQDALLVGGTIFVTGDPITVTSSLIIGEPTTILGSGSSFILPAGSTNLGFLIQSSDVTIDGIRFTGGGLASGWNSAARFVFAAGTEAAPLKNIAVRNCVLEGCQSDAIRLTWVDGATVFGNRIDGVLYSGVMLISAKNVDVIANTIRDAPLSTGVMNTYGIAATDSANTEAARTRNVRIIANTVEGVEWEGIDTHGGDGITVMGNSVRSCPRGIALVVGNNDRIAAPTNCIVQGNYVEFADAVSSREGISLFGNASSNTLADAIITGNIVVGGFSSKYHLSTVDEAKTVLRNNSPMTGEASGSFTTTANIEPGTAASYPVMFPAGRFSTPPKVMISVSQGRITPAVLDLTKDGFTANLNNWTPAAAGLFTVQWWAQA